MIKYFNKMMYFALAVAALGSPCYGAQAGAGTQTALSERFLALASRLPTPEALEAPVFTGWQRLGADVLV